MRSARFRSRRKFLRASFYDSIDGVRQLVCIIELLQFHKASSIFEAFQTVLDILADDRIDIPTGTLVVTEGLPVANPPPAPIL